jgi:serine O-acetyltransferase
VATNSYISHDVKVEDHVFIGPHVTIGGNSNLKKGCFIGMGAVIMNTTVGEKSIVGAGSVVINKVPPRVTVVGVPAKIIKRRSY